MTKSYWRTVDTFVEDGERKVLQQRVREKTTHRGTFKRDLLRHRVVPLSQLR